MTAKVRPTLKACRRPCRPGIGRVSAASDERSSSWLRLVLRRREWRRLRSTLRRFRGVCRVATRNSANSNQLLSCRLQRPLCERLSCVGTGRRCAGARVWERQHLTSDGTKSRAGLGTHPSGEVCTCPTTSRNERALQRPTWPVGAVDTLAVPCRPIEHEK